MTHPVLQRQLGRLGLTPLECPDRNSWQEFIQLLDRTYSGHDEARYLLERSLTLSLKEMEELHQRQSRDRRRLEAVIHALDRGLIVLGPSRTVELANPEAARILGTTVPELVTWTTQDLRRSIQDDPVLTDLFDGFDTDLHSRGHPAHRYEEGLLTNRDDRQIPIAVSVSPVRDGSRVTGAAIVFQDLTPRRRLEVELRSAQKLEAVGRLAAGVAHELNTPLQFIGDNLRFVHTSVIDLLTIADQCCTVLDSLPEIAPGRAELAALLAAADTESLSGELPAAIRQTLEGLDQISTIVAAMASFSHSSSATEPADLNAALRDSITVAHGGFHQLADVQFRLGELPTVMCRVSDLKQVFLNLVMNAVHAIIQRQRSVPGRGLITVTSTCEEGTHAVVEISDDGCGIPPEFADHVFEPFFTTKEVGHGIGQGLAFAHSVVVEAHAGHLTFDSGPGQGTTFRIELPVSGGADTEGSSDPSHPGQAR
jgi:PAS domain S-box-containing protein